MIAGVAASAGGLALGLALVAAGLPAAYFLLCQGLYLALSPGIVLYMVCTKSPQDFDDVARAVSGLTDRDKIVEQVAPARLFQSCRV